MSLSLKRRAGRDAALLLGSTFVVTMTAGISPALPAIERAFQTTPGVSLLADLVLTIPALTVAAGAPLTGMLMDRWGRRPVLLLSLVLVGLAGSAGFFVGSLYALLASRVLLGLGVSGAITACTALIAECFSGKERDSFLGYQSSAIWFGGMLLAQLGGILADSNWRNPFLLFLYAFLVLPLAYFFIEEPQGETAVGSGHEGEKAKAPLPWKRILPVYGSVFLRTIIFFMAVVQFPFYLEALTGAGSTEVGTAQALLNFCAGASALALGQANARFSLFRIFALLFLGSALGYVILGLASGYGTILLALAVIGASNGMMVPNFNLWIVSLVPAAARGSALGGLVMALNLGQFFSPIIIEPVAAAISLRWAYVAAGGVLLLAALAFWRAWEREAMGEKREGEQGPPPTAQLT